MQKASSMKVENLDHLGLIAGLIDEIEIVQKINELVGEYFDYAQHKQPGEIFTTIALEAAQLNESEFHQSSVTGYSWSEHKSNYGGIEQRWLVVESSLRRDADQRKLEKKLKKAEVEGQKKLRELSNIEFACDADASAAASRLSKQLKYYNLTQVTSRQTTVKPANNSTLKIFAGN
jgi:transposase